MIYCILYFFFFFNDTATTEIYTLSLHDALPICGVASGAPCTSFYVSRKRSDTVGELVGYAASAAKREMRVRSEEHTSELQSRQYLVCRLLLEKKKKIKH